MKKTLLFIGGLANVIMGSADLYISWQIFSHPAVWPLYGELVEMLSIGNAIFIFFIAYVSIFHQKEMLTTSMGKVVGTISILFYWSRAIGEFFIFSTFSWLKFLICSIIGMIYLTILFLPDVSQRPRDQ